MLKKLTALQVAIGVSVTVHVALGTAKFVDPDGFNRFFQDTPLEVILVNAKSNEAPTKAQALAQANLAGGGEMDTGRATSPLPSAALTEVGDSIEDTRKQIDQLMETQQQILATLRRELASMPPPDPKRDSGSPDERAQEDRRRQLLEQVAEIEKRINMQNARPKKRFVHPATREAVYAMYYEQMRRRIEDRGTRNFPEANGRRIYGDLTMMITVDAQGRVLETEVVRPSKSPLLDKRAVSIVTAAAPFGAFSAEMRPLADQLVMTTRFRFDNEGLETKMLAPQ